MHGNVTSTCRANSQQVTRSHAKSTYSATTARRKNDEVGISCPHNKTSSGRTTRPEAAIRSQEREPIEDTLRSSCNVFDRLGRNRDEDMCIHLEARRNSTTSRKREDLPVISPINDEINELRARLKTLAAKNTEVINFSF